MTFVEGEVLPFCGDAVNVFCSPRWLGYIYVYVFQYIYIYILCVCVCVCVCVREIIIIMELDCQHRFPCLILSICLYCSSPWAGLRDYNLCPACFIHLTRMVLGMGGHTTVVSWGVISSILFNILYSSLLQLLFSFFLCILSACVWCIHAVVLTQPQLERNPVIFHLKD